MKNIHILPTDKPTTLFKDDFDNFIYSINIDQEQNHFEPQHIYITSDEEIKEGDWVFNFEYIYIVQYDSIKHDSKFWYKKIILTTDQDLIKDGVQAIDDEFLEWFVKNPSCEKVEVKRNKKLSNKSIWDAVEGDLVFNNHNCGGVITQLSNDIRVHIISENGEGYMETAITSDNGLDTLVINNYKVYEYSDYKIIIPKEEPKQETVGRQFHKTADMVISVVRNKETLEEAAKREYETRKFNSDFPFDPQSFKLGAEWMQERMYSEEEVLELILKSKIETSNLYYEDMKEWFEQFKKK